ncbi:xanthine dehydrogenase molybdopterin binding subunit [Marinobacterium lutimaris]|uniref:Xanthine dehydrogenase, molybdenum binding subunit apoprotein n=1 Tax=Marinobacterium lutimaris TaxID=568106 RepID=A0A1H5V6U3_9GAMM|nr:xanthine dehydrogenase molybdopterin binding subunit [Marinobacterium lutimaris]SEF83122.1 xanthine dehydrogenase, molybdenum binding subunit apoprotein [Marinobacterium lutimaris]
MRNLNPVADQAKPAGATGVARAHESASKHVSGAATYVDDIVTPQGTLHAAVGYSRIARGHIRSLDLSGVRGSEGVIAVLEVADIPGHTDIGPVFPGDPLLTSDEIKYAGQPIFVVAAETELQARRAVTKAKIDYESREPLLDVTRALKEQTFVRPSHHLQRGDEGTAIEDAPLKLSAEQHVGGQEHFYLEGQASLAVPGEDGGMLVYSSTQHPSEVQKLVAEVLDVPVNRITVDMRRMGGGFGGKETQGAPWACMAALLARKTGKAVKLRLPRCDDMPMTGKRHPFYNSYEIGFDLQGRLQGAKIVVAGNCGHSPDLSDAIVDRAMFHADNAYFIPHVSVDGHRCMTNTVSHTAFRGFGGPQGMMIIERAMDDIARAVGRDPLDVRKLNLYGGEGRNLTPYHQTVEHNALPELIDRLEESSDYRERRAEITEWNKTSRVLKRGLALTPVKFGISFTMPHLNQAGALVHIYTDGSIQVNHGGTEMGQGLHTKVVQIVAEALSVSVDEIQITATRTDKVPNTSPTAASSGTDLNGQAARNAALELKKRISECIAEQKGCALESVRFESGRIYWAADDASEEESMSFPEAAQFAYFHRISLSATGYYRTPKIWYDREQAKGRPFFYFANGAAVSEVVIDTLTGEYRVLGVDILHDVGRSLNPAVDLGQIEGGFIQGMGWLTTEELQWNAEGLLTSNSPANYKIPAISDTPPRFNVALFERDNEEETVYHSKAVGEPPFMLAISVWSALRDAIASLADYHVSPALDTPATPERVLKAVMETRKSAQVGGKA